MLTSRLTLVARGRYSQVLLKRYASTDVAGKGKQKLVILGSGWAGYNVARKVDKDLYDTTVISPNSYFSFTPFLASTAVGTLEFRCATEPVRGLKRVKYAQGWADSFDFANKTIEVEPALSPLPQGQSADAQSETPNQTSLDKFKLSYDKLVISVGCYSADFGIPGVSKYAFFLKDIKDARNIRMRILERLEQAVHPSTSPELREKLLSFSIVGAGPTGCEFAAELHDFIEEDVYSRLLPELRGQVKITVYDVAPGILMSFDKSLRDYAEAKFAREGIQTRPNSRITAVGPDWIELEGKQREPFGLLVWSTGLSPNPLMEKLEDVAKDEKTKSIRVNEYLEVLDNHLNPVPGVFAIGDNAMPVSGRLPATAQVATQQAKYTAKLLNSLAVGGKKENSSGFRWKNKGSMVLLGDKEGIMDRSSDTISGPRNKISGFAAWVAWRSYYMLLAMGWRNKIAVPTVWCLTYFFGRDVTRF